MAKNRAKFNKKRKGKITVREGIVNILATYNNTFITISNNKGNVLIQYTPAKLGFKNTKKRTAYAATQAAIAAGQLAKEKFGLETVKVLVKGVGMGRNPAIKGLASSGLNIKMIVDTSKPPFNGPRPRKKPRK